MSLSRRPALLLVAALSVFCAAAADCVIRREDGWTPAEGVKDIDAGSALDFSFLVERPAGRYGRAKAVGDHFEFEKRPGTPQRFRGVNLTGLAFFLDDGEIDRLTTRLVRMGYNSIRLIHHDGHCMAITNGHVTVSERRMERLDRLFAVAAEKGIYITLDLQVSRPVWWNWIGVNREGRCGRDVFKALVPIYEPAYRHWAEGTRAFLNHVNVYTGRRYADDPTLLSLSLVNEGGWMLSWGSVRKEEIFRDVWKKWIAEYRRRHPGAFPGLDDDEPSGDLWHPESNPKSAAFAVLEAAAERSFMRRARALVGDEIGCMAPLTDQNWGPNHLPMAGTRATCFDYADCHFYIDHPQFVGGQWALPVKYPNHNPFFAKSHRLPMVAVNRVFGKPFTLTEYAVCAPSAYRGAGGLMIGAFAALQGWSGIWRFAYAHGNGHLFAERAEPTFFDLALDPFAVASETAAAMLFLRGDMKPASESCTVLLDDDALRPQGSEALRIPAGWCRDAMWRVRMGCALPECADGFSIPSVAAFGTNTAPPKAFSPDPQLRLGGTRALAVVDTPCTVGGFSPAADVSFDAGALHCDFSGTSHATVWASSLDGHPVRQSMRILLVHLTECQRDGSVFVDEKRNNLKEWGHEAMLRNGSCNVSLALERPDGCKVYALDCAGRRRREVVCRIEGMRLVFCARVEEDPTQATMFYEIVAR